MKKVLFLSFLISCFIAGPAFALTFSVDEATSDITLSGESYWVLFGIGYTAVDADLATPYSNPYVLGDGETMQFEFATLAIEGRNIAGAGSADVSATVAFDTGLDPYYSEGHGAYATIFGGVVDAGYLNWTSDPGIITLGNGDYFEVALLDIDFGIDIGCNNTYSIFAEVTGHAAPVPEPGTIVLMGLGLVGLAGMGRKKLFKK